MLGTRGVEETVVFYRRDVDTSLVASTELLSASHDLSVTDSVHSMITQSVFTLCNHTLNRLRRNPSELSNMLSFAIGVFIANGDITDKKLRKALRDKTPQIIAPEIDLKDPSWGYVYLPTDSGKRFRPCSTLKEAYTGVKFHSKKGQESYLYQDLQNSNTIVIDTDDEVSTNIMLQLFESKTEIWLNDSKTSAHFVFGADEQFQQKAVELVQKLLISNPEAYADAMEKSKEEVDIDDVIGLENFLIKVLELSEERSVRKAAATILKERVLLRTQLAELYFDVLNGLPDEVFEEGEDIFRIICKDD